MSVNSDFYLARAADCAQQARDATLSNVRERCLRSEAAWREMADRVLQAETSRSRQEADKARISAAVE